MKEEVTKTEWSKAQEAVISVDLVKAAKQQLRFLLAVDAIGNLYDGPALDRAIYRYKYCWLPLLAEHVVSPVTTGPLVVPLDCEWIWHCHRLSPVQYKTDCEEIFGKTLDNLNVLLTTQVTSTKQSEIIWNKMYPMEPYHLKPDVGLFPVTDQRSISYDLKAAVKRQSSFLHKVRKSIAEDDSFLEEAVARYKAFLHLIKRKRESPVKYSCVPTEDIDLIWHTHQLYPVSYHKDLMKILGKIADHNDRDSSNGVKLRIGFIQTTKFWEDIFGCPYLRASVTHHAYDDQVAKSYKPSGKATYGFDEYMKILAKPQNKCCDNCVDG